MSKKVSIIIPIKEFDTYAKECIRKCESLDYDNFEIILLPDFALENIPKFKKELKIIPTGKILPGLKRNIGVNHAEGVICAFIDADAFPDRNWIRKAIVFLEDENIAAVGGPNLTPEDDSLAQKLSGIILSCWTALGKFSTRYKIFRLYYPMELPSCNFIIKKEIFKKIGGFSSDLLTAEDAELCFNIKKIGKKILYSPEVMVFHHRRPIFKLHFQQIFIYARDKSKLLKKLSWKEKLERVCYYVLPIGLISFLTIIILSLFLKKLLKFSISMIGIYTFLILIESFTKNKRYFYLLGTGIVGTHFSYLLGFLKGMIEKR
ncbi:MAG: hypothetical protein B6D56_08075 [Candidatus Omnitrophica bacterium 4484_70.1]|nr:MAG: hypothetical protein B6D56_08075 [Candidatus Omnitrophica bacterium 4484_70.1]